MRPSFPLGSIVRGRAGLLGRLAGGGREGVWAVGLAAGRTGRAYAGRFVRLGFGPPPPAPRIARDGLPGRRFGAGARRPFDPSSADSDFSFLFSGGGASSISRRLARFQLLVPLDF